MACLKHNLRMVRLVLRGRMYTPEHAELLADVRRCRRCPEPATAPRPTDRPAPTVPRVRVEGSVRELEDARH